MRRAELEQVLRDAGFSPTPKSRHDIWRHPSGVSTVVSRGTQVTPRADASVRVTIRRVQRLTGGK